MTPILGLNIFRAVAVIMMIIAHSIRIQANYSTLVKFPGTATFWDQCLLFFIHIEPIISAQFLFISGFSLTLSLYRSSLSKQEWLLQLPSKLVLLYLISVLFFIGDNGIQLPDLFVSSGILSIIAVSMAITGCILVTPKPLALLSLSVISILCLAYYFEQSKIVVTGLNGGAGGAIPLMSMTLIGGIIGIIFQRFNTNGLIAATLVGCFIGVVCLSTSYPWTFDVRGHFLLFKGDPVTSVLHSIQYALGDDSHLPMQASVRFWNHSSIFPLRVTGGLSLVLLAFIFCFKHYANRATKTLNELGKHGLLIYVFHLLLLGVIEVSGIKPVTGWQTWLLIMVIVALGVGIIRMRDKSGNVRRKLLDSFDPGTQ